MSKICCFVMSPGRCGTQWLAQMLALQLRESFRVEHEAIDLDYMPMENSPSEPLKINGEKIEKHLNSILDTLNKGQNYIETGFPNWCHIQWLQQKLVANGINVKVIHLVRPLIENAVSLLKIGAFIPPIMPHETMKNLMNANAKRTAINGVKALWPQTTPFEKNIMYCAEVHAQAQLVRANIASNDWLPLEFGDLFTTDTARTILAFLESPFDERQYSSQVIDNYGIWGITQPPDYVNPKVVEIVRSLNLPLTTEIHD